MFSGLVIVTMLVATGSVMATDLITTGMVIKKMISSTNMMSTSGVVLIVELTSSSASPAGRLIDMEMSFPTPRYSGSALGRQQIGLQVVGEGAEFLANHLIAADQEVVAKHGRHRDQKAERGHD